MKEQEINELMNCELTRDGNVLTKQEKVAFERFLNTLKGASVVYRGANDSYLYNVYKTDSNNMHLLSQYLFMLGVKGMAFYKDKIKKVSILNVSNDVLCHIYDKLQKAFVKTDKFRSKTTRERLKKIIRRQPELKDFFTKTTRENWIDKISNLPEEDKQVIKDYYISFLHTIGLAGYGDYTYFTSTSLRKDVAEGFKGSSHGIVIVGWTNQKNIKCTYDHGAIDRVQSLGLPVIEPLYEEQCEITYKCGLLPHYIIGYHYGENLEKFEINPCVFDVNNERVRTEGLPINQNNFEKMMKGTNFKSYYMMLDEFYWTIEDIINL